MLSNPILTGFHPDPSVCRVGEDYYLVCSSFEFFPGVPIYHSRDLVSWRQLGHVLDRSSQLPLQGITPSQGIYAPTIRHHEGTFYVITTNVTRGGNFIVTAQNPAGPWSEPLWLEPHGIVQGIDPDLFFDDDGRVYLSTTDPEDRQRGIFQCELDAETFLPLGPRTLIWSGTGGMFPEGPHLYRRDGWYYLLISEGGTFHGHMLTVARSSTPRGPWEPAPHNPILTHRSQFQTILMTGHGDFVDTPNGETWLVFHGTRPLYCGQLPETQHLGRETCLAPVAWNDACWPIVNNGHPIASRIEAVTPPPQPFPPEPVRDDFDSITLRKPWCFVRNPEARLTDLLSRPGCLRLTARGADAEDAVFRRQEHFFCTVRTRLLKSSGETGLVVMMNSAHVCHFGVVVRANGGRSLLLRRRIGEVCDVKEHPLPSAGAVDLAIHATVDRYRFCLELGDSAPPVELGSIQTRYLSNEVAGGFTGVFFGLYAGADSSGDFDWFDYAPAPAEQQP